LKIFYLNSSKSEKTALEKAVRILNQGGIVAHPTETVFGLAADPRNPSAIAKIHAIKKTNPNKPLLINLPNKSWLTKLAQKTCCARKFVKNFWPGPLTLILLSKNSTEKIGLRYSSHLFTQKLTRKFGRPIISSSANLTGKPPAKNAIEVQKIFAQQKNQVDLILEDNSKSFGKPSTILDLTSKPKIIREGAVSIDPKGRPDP
jgi:L-threonylcarbamoyladenylate synthase